MPQCAWRNTAASEDYLWDAVRRHAVDVLVGITSSMRVAELAAGAKQAKTRGFEQHTTPPALPKRCIEHRSRIAYTANTSKTSAS